MWPQSCNSFSSVSGQPDTCPQGGTLWQTGLSHNHSDALLTCGRTKCRCFLHAPRHREAHSRLKLFRAAARSLGTPDSPHSHVHFRRIACFQQRCPLPMGPLTQCRPSSKCRASTGPRQACPCCRSSHLRSRRLELILPFKEVGVLPLKDVAPNAVRGLHSEVYCEQLQPAGKGKMQES
jgi:hypothetical protein